ncbi:MAG: 30S ribosome-binding factor RbfA [Muribaculaceae bacterium]|nr:30S ribosome-binding factor RbfA [Muribaculaceae bacterium]MBR4721564.1 30S ribosome-binding factor RbfA [Muribaculaceae bacterium]
METTRQAKIARLIQKELSDIFRLETAQVPGSIVSVSVVRVSPDLSVARAYLSVFPSEKAAEVIAAVNDNSRAIRHNLAQRVRYQLRKTPELTFFLDDSLDYIDNIDNILNKDKEEHPWHDPKDWEGLDEIYKDLK